jgi:tetrapyrrole methylase family protein/MazG family protein
LCRNSAGARIGCSAGARTGCRKKALTVDDKVKSRNDSAAGGSGKAPPDLGDKLERLAGVMALLRSPNGCPWDLQQTPRTLAKHLLEEAYESVDAIDSGNWEHLCEELGDLLLQIVFQSRIAEERGRFDLGEVVDGITEKLERRHPHIFGEVNAETAEQVSINWDRIKREEEGKETGISLPSGLPALMTARKIQGHAARDGFDWSSVEGVVEKLHEELLELCEARGGTPELLEREVGDVLFTVVNLARHLDVDAEHALQTTAREFVRRYGWMEEEAKRRGISLASIPINEKEELWQKAKQKDQGQETELDQ